jgi:hypothetical protein
MRFRFCLDQIAYFNYFEAKKKLICVGKYFQAIEFKIRDLERKSKGTLSL